MAMCSGSTAVLSRIAAAPSTCSLARGLTGRQHGDVRRPCGSDLGPGASSSTSPVPLPPHRNSRVLTRIVSRCRSRMNMSRGLGCRGSGVGLALWNSSPRPCGSWKAPRLPTLAGVNASSGCQERGGGQWLSDRDPIFRTGPSSGPGVACSPQAFVDLRSG